MGFRNNTFATVWEVKSVSNTMTRARISISKKNKNTGEYEQDFGGWVAFIGTGCAGKAARLKERDKIRILEVDVDNRYVKEKQTTYTNFKIFAFEAPNEIDTNSGLSSTARDALSGFVDNVGDGEVDDELLPY